MDHGLYPGAKTAVLSCSTVQVLSVTLCLIALIYLLTDGEDFKHALGFIVVLLVASIPIAIEIVR